MSENIQSISNGSFVLGQTSATNFQAGPGIKIDSPSEGVVRIGNDETVLWSGNAETGTTAQLSESKNNFEYLNIEYKDQNSFVGVTQVPTSGNYYGFNLTTHYPNSNTQIIYRFGFVSAVDDTHLNYFKGGRVVFSTRANDFAMTSPPNIQRIVGINRISGSNA